MPTPPGSRASTTTPTSSRSAPGSPRARRRSRSWPPGSAPSSPAAGTLVLGPNLSHVGHLTAGSPVNYSGKFYSIVAYCVRKDTELIDLDEVRDLAKKHRPRLVIAGGSAFPRAIDFKPFGEIAREVGATLMADIAHPAGLVAAGLHPSPVGIADFVTATTHKTLRGPRGGMVMCRL